MAKQYERRRSVVPSIFQNQGTQRVIEKELGSDINPESSLPRRKYTLASLKRSSVGQLFFGKSPSSNSINSLDNTESTSEKSSRKASIAAINDSISDEEKFIEAYQRVKQSSTLSLYDLPLDSKNREAVEFFGSNEEFDFNQENNSELGLVALLENRSKSNYQKKSLDSSGLRHKNSGIYQKDRLRKESIAPRERSNSVSGPSYAQRRLTMKKNIRVLIIGSKKSGKTAFLQQLTKAIFPADQVYCPTIEDTYQIQLESPERGKEHYTFHDTSGFSDYGPTELKKSCVQIADAIIITYSVLDNESFNKMDILKKHIDKFLGKERQNVPIVIVGTMNDIMGRKVDIEFAQTWASKEKVKLFDVTNCDRKQLLDVINFIGTAQFLHKESKFSFSKKLKPEKSSAAILMDL